MDHIADWLKIALPVAVFLYFVWRMFGQRIRNLFDSVVSEDQGNLVGVDISVTKHARLKDVEEPLSTRLVARLPSGDIVTDGWRESTYGVPRPIRGQVFANGGFVINQFEPKINSSDPREQQDAIRQMKDSYYRFWLHDPAPATIKLRKSGARDIVFQRQR